MLRLSLLCVFLLICAFFLDSVVDAKRPFGHARRDILDRAEREAKKAQRASPKKLRTRSRTSDFRFYSNKSAPYNVESLPLMTFDIGEFYSGTIPVDKAKPDRQMFFVFQPRVQGPPVDEVTIWFNGGPGCSSLEGFLQENGYFQWGWGMQTPLINKYAWPTLTNMLWVEYPIGVGFSTGDVTAKSEEETAQDFIGFFKNFQEIMGIKNFKIYVTGESYAGRYVPYVSAAMLDQKDKTHFDLTGSLMYDPCIGQFEYANQATIAPFVKKHKNFLNLGEEFLADLELQHDYCGFRNFTHFYDSFPPRAQQPALLSNVSDQCDLWTKTYNEAYRPNPCFNVYEINIQCPILFDPLGFPSDIVFNYPNNTVYFNRPDVKKAMHAPMDVEWSECTSGFVFVGSGGPYGLGDHSIDPIQKVLPQVIEATNRVLVANGDYDMEIITKGTLLSIQNMTWNGKMGFQKRPSKPIDIKLPDKQYSKVILNSGLDIKGVGFDGPGQGVMGQQHYERGLMWAETFQSGHMQPQFQARSSYRHLQWLLGRIDEL